MQILWKTVKYLNIWHHNSTNKQLQHFFITHGNIITFLFWVLWTCLATSIKNNNVNLQKLWCLPARKKWTPSLTSYLGCYFQYCENAWSYPWWVLSPCRKLWCLKFWNWLVGNADVYLDGQKSISSLTSFLRYCKDIANLLFWEVWECLTISIKNHSINML